MLTKPIWILSIFLLSSIATPKPEGKEKIEWLTLEEVSAKMKNDPRPVIIDLYARWCYWCKVMDKKTYNHSKVVDYINEKFYPVKLDAESKQTLQWDNRNFNFNPGLKLNDFSVYVTNGQLSFPTTVIYTSIKEAPATIPGFMSPDEIEPVLKYFGENYYKREGFQEFLKSFKKDW
jgi:thioredoxin-related protein